MKKVFIKVLVYIFIGLICLYYSQVTNIFVNTFFLAISILFLHNALKNVFNLSTNERPKTKIIVFGLVYIIIIGYFLNPFFNSVLFYFQQILLYGIIAFLIIFLAYNIYQNVKTQNLQEKRLKFVKGFILSMIVVTLLIVGNLQIFFINHYLVPQVYGCSYYDQYANLIYNSQYTYSCPALNQVTIKHNDDKSSELSFTVDEKNTISNEEYKIHTEIVYKYNKYNKDNQVIEYEASEHYYFHDLKVDSYSETGSYKQIINTYSTNKVTTTVNQSNFLPENNVLKETKKPTILYISTKNNIDSVTITKEDLSTNVVEELFNIQGFLCKDYLIHKVNDIGTIELRPKFSKTYLVQAFGSSGNDNTIKSEIYKTYNGELALSGNYQIINNYILTNMKYKNTNIESQLVKVNFGYKLTHYLLDRNSLGMLAEKNRNLYAFNLSVPTNKINDYENMLYNMYFFPYNFVYQKNPWLFENQDT